MREQEVVTLKDRGMSVKPIEYYAYKETPEWTTDLTRI